MELVTAEPGPLDLFSAPTREWFGAAFASPTPAQAGAWAAIGAGQARAGRGADRVRQDAERVPVVDRPAAHRATARRQDQALPRALHLAAEGARRRRRAQPALAPHRHPPHRRPARHAHAGAAGRRAVGRHQRCRPAPADHPAARHHDHDAGVAVPDADQPGARVPARRRDGDHRRGARGRRHQARRPPGDLARATRRPARPAGPADRPVGHGAPARRGGPLPRWRGAGRDRGSSGREALGPQGRRARRGHDRTRGLRRGRRRAGRPRHQHLAARRGVGRRPDRAAQLHDRLRQLPPPGRAPHRAAQRDRHRARHRRVRGPRASRPPRSWPSQAPAPARRP